MRLVNIGCGGVYHPDWINLDKLPRSGEVQAYDISRPLPFADDSVDVCYSSHVLEHLPRPLARRFLLDCRRALKPGGIARLAVPDLAGITQSYLQCLSSAESGDPQALANYEWSVLELLDQLLRNQSGGEMGAYLRQKDLANADFIRSRLGQEAEGFWAPAPEERSLLEKLRLKGWPWVWQKLRLTLAEGLVLLTAGAEARDAFREGLFRRSGEIHQWMYDRLSLTQLLRETGFESIQICGAAESRIPNFSDYELDTQGEQIRKPDSLFIEALKRDGAGSP